MWFYEVPMRADVKAYTQHQPFRFEEFQPCIQWWGARPETDNAWKVPRRELKKHDYSYAFKNPRSSGGFQFADPSALVTKAKSSLDKLVSDMPTFKAEWDTLRARRQEWPSEPLAKLIVPVERQMTVEAEEEYAVLAMSWYAKGLYVKHKKMGQAIKATNVYRVEEGDFVYNRLFAWKGSFAEASPENHGCVVSNEFPCFRINHEKVAKGYLWAYFAQPALWSYIESLSTGTTSTSRLRLKEQRLLKLSIPVPPTDIQENIAAVWARALASEREIQDLAHAFSETAPAIFERIVAVG